MTEMHLLLATVYAEHSPALEDGVQMIAVPAVCVEIVVGQAGLRAADHQTEIVGDLRLVCDRAVSRLTVDDFAFVVHKITSFVGAFMKAEWKSSVFMSVSDNYSVKKE